MALVFTSFTKVNAQALPYQSQESQWLSTQLSEAQGQCLICQPPSSNPSYRSLRQISPDMILRLEQDAYILLTPEARAKLDERISKRNQTLAGWINEANDRLTGRLWTSKKLNHLAKIINKHVQRARYEFNPRRKRMVFLGKGNESKGQCKAAVLDILRDGGIVSDKGLRGPPAKRLHPLLGTLREGGRAIFKNLYVRTRGSVKEQSKRNIDMAPIPSVLVYSGGASGHVEIKTIIKGKVKYCSDFCKDTPISEYLPRKLTGVYQPTHTGKL